MYIITFLKKHKLHNLHLFFIVFQVAFSFKCLFLFFNFSCIIWLKICGSMVLLFFPPTIMSETSLWTAFQFTLLFLLFVFLFVLLLLLLFFYNGDPFSYLLFYFSMYITLFLSICFFVGPDRSCQTCYCHAANFQGRCTFLVFNDHILAWTLCRCFFFCCLLLLLLSAIFLSIYFLLQLSTNIQ
jgi:hypothetical protein